MLSNINVDKDQLLQIILVGQPQLRDLLRKPELQQFFQRVAVDFFIPPLLANEISKYIRHRLKVAGRKSPLFTQPAIKHISEATKGIPRSINILCDMTLVYGFSSGAKMIGKKLVEEVLRDRSEFGLYEPTPPLGENGDSDNMLVKLGLK
jgi:type II secretory pathway predicted ATPase ExeA